MCIKHAWCTTWLFGNLMGCQFQVYPRQLRLAARSLMVYPCVLADVCMLSCLLWCTDTATIGVCYWQSQSCFSIFTLVIPGTNVAEQAYFHTDLFAVDKLACCATNITGYIQTGTCFIKIQQLLSIQPCLGESPHLVPVQ